MKVSFFALILILTSCASNQKTAEDMIKNKKARLYYDQGTQELADKEYTAALGHLQKAYKHEPDNTHILNNLGMAYYFKGATGSAIKFIDKALDLDAKNTPARMNLATIHMKNKDYGAAEKEYIKITKDLTYMAQFRTYFNLGLLYQAKGMQKKANNYFNKAIKENENYCPAHFQLANHFYKKRDYKMALKKYKDASFGVCYNNPIPHLKQAKTLSKLGRYKKARITLNKIIERFGTTKYRSIAQNELREINRLEKSSFNEGERSAIRDNGKILTPDF